DVHGVAARDVARDEVAERRIALLEEVVAVLLRDAVRILVAVLLLAGDPDAAVVAERLAHERELRLIGAALRDAGRVDLREAGVREGRARAVRAPRRRAVGALGVGREVDDVAVAAGREDDDGGRGRLDLAGDEAARHDAARLAVDDDELEHLGARVHLDGARRDLALERRVGAEEELLTRLAARVERAADLRAAERAVGEVAAVLTREGHALRDALIDDVHRELGEAVDVRLARAEVAALHGVVEEAEDAVAVVLVVLGRVDAALRGDRVGAPRAVL